MSIQILDGVTLDTIIFCEDVRQELNGKMSLLGVFSADILLQSFPTALRAAVYMEGTVTRPYKDQLHFRFRLNDTEVLSVSGNLDTQEGRVVLPLSGLILPVPEEGTLHFEASADKETWTEIMAKSITVGEFKDGILIQPSA